MSPEKLARKSLESQDLSLEEIMFLYRRVSLSSLIFLANRIRYQKHNNKNVTWLIDRNVNITNVCVSQCLFCNFCRGEKGSDTYITSLDEYQKKIEELFALGGNQLLIQGGMHPGLGLDFYRDLFTNLKKLYPQLRLHALGPPEIVFLAEKESKSVEFILQSLIQSGLDSLPGAGAEILSDRVRKLVSPKKCSSAEWLEVMRLAHRFNLPTSATMMAGHLETDEERMEHLIKIRDLQSRKPEGSYGFLSFIPWTFQDKETRLAKKFGVTNGINAAEYIRLVAISRIVLHNISNIQPSWLTVGVQVAQMCLHAGANDFGSVMIEENVVSSAGAKNSINNNQMIQAISEAGFVPVLRNQKFETINQQI